MFDVDEIAKVHLIPEYLTDYNNYEIAIMKYKFDIILNSYGGGDLTVWR